MGMSNKAVLVLIATLMIGAMARGQDAPPSVTSTGSCTATEKPDTLRLTMLISAQAPDVRAAIAKLKQQREEINGKLVAIGANHDTLKFSDPAEGTQGNLTPQQRMMQQMMAMQRGHTAPTSQPSGVTVSTEMTAEWPLAAASPDDALIAANELEGKIKSVMAGAAATAAKTPEEQEVAEEMAAQASADTTKSDEPKFVFVHKLTDDERAKLLGEAFGNAQAQAKRLAAAAGKQMGPVLRISTSNTDVENPQNAYIQAIIDAQTGETKAMSSADEVVGDAPGNLNYAVSVTVTFSLQ